MSSWIVVDDPKFNGRHFRRTGDDALCRLYIDAGDWVLWVEVDGLKASVYNSVSLAEVIRATDQPNVARSIHREHLERESARLRTGLAQSLSALRREDYEAANGLVDDLMAYVPDGLSRALREAGDTA